MSLQDNGVNVFYDFMIKSLIRYITNLASLVALDTVLVESNAFTLSRDLGRPRDQRVMQLYR